MLSPITDSAPPEKRAPQSRWGARCLWQGRRTPPPLPCVFTLLPLHPLPFRVQFCDGRPDGESPGKHRKILEFVWNGVAVLRFFHGHPRLVHFLRLPRDVVEYFANARNAVLPADLSMTRDEKRVLIEGGEFLQGLAPSGDGRLFVKAHRI